MTEIIQILQALQEIAEDQTIPKNVRTVIQTTMVALQQPTTLRLNASKALQHLETLSETTNVEAFTRSQLYNIVSMLETIR